MRFDSNSPNRAFNMESRGNTFRRGLNTMLFEVRSDIGRRTNFTITVFIVISVLLSMAGTMQNLEQVWVERIKLMEIWVTLLFGIEFVGRCYAARSVRAYLFSFYGVVDMLAILPMLLIGDPNIAIRLLRILRLLKLVRYLRAMRLFISSMRDTMEMLAMVFGETVASVSGGLQKKMELL